eukprot:TRINITY_DN23532_c0_g2_i1.p1 TRINITY_DN23532_c0_g2~~TRINITY_DN23532_c0_g2_i1.p1  ORF type:complete len:336 (-),score=99.21 TRINITY_DN23532_c0_g2_i1:56-1033(-)
MVLQRRWLGAGKESQASPGEVPDVIAEDSKAKTKKLKASHASDESGGKTAAVAGKKAKAAASKTEEVPGDLSKKSSQTPEKDSGAKKKKKAATPKSGEAPTPAAEVTEAAPSAKKKILTSADKARARRARQKKKQLSKERSAKRTVKDPEAAAEYLRLWELQRSGSQGGWRFNKATQAWLIRHAYEPDKVAKDAFAVLLRYLEGLNGGARDRMRTEANAIVTLRGAPLAEEQQQLPPAEEKESPEEPAEGKKKRKKKPDAAAGGINADVAESGEAVAEADGTATQLAEAEENAEELKRRKMRLRRAKQVLNVLGDGSDAPDADEH